MNPEMPLPNANAEAALTWLGQGIRARRKQLGISATALAEAAGVSRVTLHRIEKGAATVAAGAYASTAAALGLVLHLDAAGEPAAAADDARAGWLPARVPLRDYPQLRQLAWHVSGADTLTPAQAWGLYARNARHLDLDALAPAEQQLIAALRIAFDGTPEADV